MAPATFTPLMLRFRQYATPIDYAQAAAACRRRYMFHTIFFDTLSPLHSFLYASRR